MSTSTDAVATPAVAVVTGSARGIGKGIVARLLADGYRVVANDIDGDALRLLSNDLGASASQLVLAQADVSDESNVDALMDTAIDAFGAVDVIVNNAGWSRPVEHLLTMGTDHWDSVIRTNLRSTFLVTRGAARWLVANDRPGSIICVSSFGAQRAHRSMSAYDASKGGIESFIRAASLDLAPFGIRVNGVGPGAIHTEAFDHLGEPGQAERSRPVPLGRVGTPADVAAAVKFLASPDADYITGQIVYVDGGILAQLRPADQDIVPPESVWDLRKQPVTEGS